MLLEYVYYKKLNLFETFKKRDPDIQYEKSLKDYKYQLSFLKFRHICRSEFPILNNAQIEELIRIAQKEDEYIYYKRFSEVIQVWDRSTYFSNRNT